MVLEYAYIKVFFNFSNFEVAPRSNKVVDTKNNARFGIYSKIGGVELLWRPCKMKTVASTPCHQMVNCRRPLQNKGKVELVSLAA